LKFFIQYSLFIFNNVILTLYYTINFLIYSSGLERGGIHRKHCIAYETDADKIIVVDDNSTDRTAGVTTSLGH